MSVCSVQTMCLNTCFCSAENAALLKETREQFANVSNEDKVIGATLREVTFEMGWG